MKSDIRNVPAIELRENCVSMTDPLIYWKLMKLIHMSSSILGLLHWTLIPDHSITGYNHDFLNGLSLHGCMQECENLIPTCLEIDYSKTGRCVIGTIFPLLAPLKSDTNYDLYYYCEMRITNGKYSCVYWFILYVCMYVWYISYLNRLPSGISNHVPSKI